VRSNAFGPLLVGQAATIGDAPVIEAAGAVQLDEHRGNRCNRHGATFKPLCSGSPSARSRDYHDRVSTFLVLSDGRAWITSNGIYDTLIESIVEGLVAENGPGPLAAWLLEQRCLVQGPGVGYLDLRELAPPGRQEVERALRPALARLAQSPNQMVATSVAVLEAMLTRPDAVDPNVRGGRLPATDCRKGPGW